MRLYRTGQAVALTALLLAGAADAKIYRSSAAVAAFKRAHPCPATLQPRGRCPGWIVDHVIALKRGGPDLPCNMQWQTITEAKAKDRWE